MVPDGLRLGLVGFCGSGTQVNGIFEHVRFMSKECFVLGALPLYQCSTLKMLQWKPGQLFMVKGKAHSLRRDASSALTVLLIVTHRGVVSRNGRKYGIISQLLTAETPCAFLGALDFEGGEPWRPSHFFFRPNLCVLRLSQRVMCCAEMRSPTS
ncbi:unnamed protein product [Durusdinium trenchii]|uniref:Uncharacterized protein n=2 Tax=Durusdinium trenchii TaxID=1381693 RepID=A0ABP0PJK1_9DINO